MVRRESRRRDSHPHGPRYELGAFLKSRHTGQEQRDKDSNPVRRLWRPRALPGASLCVLRRAAGFIPVVLYVPEDDRDKPGRSPNKGGAGGIEPLTSAFTEPRANRYTTCRIFEQCKVKKEKCKVKDWDDHFAFFTFPFSLCTAPVILGGVEPPISSVSGRRLEPLGHRIIHSTPARIRTWNAAFEARNDGPFHHQGRSVQSEKGKVQSWQQHRFSTFHFALLNFALTERRGRDSNPHALEGARVSTAARPAVSVSRPYPSGTAGS